MESVSLDPVLHLLAAVFYAAAFAFLAVRLSLARGPERAPAVFGVVGLMLHFAGIGVRWFLVGHGPIVTQYENLSSYAAATALVAGYFLVAAKRAAPLGLVLYPAAFLMLGAGLYAGPEVANLPPTFSGIWLVLHVCFYFAAFSTAVTAVGASLLIASAGRLSERVPQRYAAPDELDRIAYRFAGLAFTFWGTGMLTGAIWAYNAWGRYWAWDPVESWSLVTWLLLGAYLHLRRFYSWEGQQASVLLVTCFVFALVALFGTAIMPDSLHSVYFR